MLLAVCLNVWGFIPFLKAYHGVQACRHLELTFPCWEINWPTGWKNKTKQTHNNKTKSLCISTSIVKLRRYITLFSLFCVLAIIHNLKLTKSNNQIKPDLWLLSSPFPKSSRSCFLMLLSFAMHNGNNKVYTEPWGEQTGFHFSLDTGRMVYSCASFQQSTVHFRTCSSSLTSKETHLFGSSSAFSASEWGQWNDAGLIT